MKKVFWMIFIHQFQKSLKSPVWEIFHIIQLIGRRMGYKYIKSLMPPQFPPQFPDTCPHSPFCILVWCPWYIFHGTSQPQNTHTLVYINIIFNTDTAFRRFLLIFSVMIALYIQKRGMAQCSKKCKIFRRQITAGNDQINILHPFRIIILI